VTAKNVILLFVLYGGPAIASLLFLMLGYAMARTRVEVLFTGALVGLLAAIQAGELWFLWSLRMAWGGESGDPLVTAGAAIAACALILNVFFIRAGLKRAHAGSGSLQ
jgi:hypothetical protein